MQGYTYHIERFDQTYAEMEPLYRQHFAEMKAWKVAKGLPVGDYNLDVQGYFDNAQCGQLISYVARCDLDPVGYLHVYVCRDHRTGQRVAYDDSLFVLPDHRTGAGARLIKFALDDLMKHRATRLSITAAGDPRVAKLLARIGFKQSAIEMTYNLEGAQHVRT